LANQDNSLKYQKTFAFYHTLKPQDFSNLDGRQESGIMKILEGRGLF